MTTTTPHTTVTYTPTNTGRVIHAYPTASHVALCGHTGRKQTTIGQRCQACEHEATRKAMWTR